MVGIFWFCSDTYLQESIIIVCKFDELDGEVIDWVEWF